MAIREKTPAGGATFVRVFNQGPKVKGKRKAKANPTVEAVERNNQKNAERDLAIKLCHNFDETGLHCVLTYREIPTREEARSTLQKLKRKLAGKKWICATEYENARLHHHLVVGESELEEIQAAWPHGVVLGRKLDRGRDYRRLAAYLIKETSKTFRLPGAVSRRRYTCSRLVEKGLSH